MTFAFNLCKNLTVLFIKDYFSNNEITKFKTESPIAVGYILHNSNNLSWKKIFNSSMRAFVFVFVLFSFVLLCFVFLLYVCLFVWTQSFEFLIRSWLFTGVKATLEQFEILLKDNNHRWLNSESGFQGHLVFIRFFRYQ